MVGSIYRRVVKRLVGDSNSCVQKRTHTVRRNASPILHSPSLFFSSWIPKGMGSRRHSGRIPVEGRNADSVKALLRDFGFNDTQISELAWRLPSILERTTKKNLLPKLKFFSSVGVPFPDLPKLFIQEPLLLSSSLEKQIIPCYNCLKNIPLKDEHVIHVLKCDPQTFLVKAEIVLVPNIELLREIGIPLSSISHFVLRYVRALWRSHEHFKNSVNQAIEMGQKPSTKTFLKAVYVLCSISKQTWDRKVELFRSFGLSEDEISLASRRNPMIMALSEKKIARVLEYFVNELGLAPGVFASCPALLDLSLDRRIVPRCQVMEILMANGLEKRISPSTFLRLTEENFFNRFVYRYKDDLPELMDIYNGGVSAESRTDHIAPSK